MTIKEFAEKYDVDYNIVYLSTWNIKPENGRIRGKEYDEIVLMDAVRDTVRKRVDKHEKELARARRLMEKLGK